MENIPPDNVVRRLTAYQTLGSLGACYSGLVWVWGQPDQSPQTLWDECPRGDWLAWYLGRLAKRDGHGSRAHRRAVLIACLCARSVSMQWRDMTNETALSLAEKWAWGDESATRVALHADTTYAVYTAYADNASNAAADAADASAAYAAAAGAASAAYAAAAGAASAAYAAASAAAAYAVAAGAASADAAYAAAAEAADDNADAAYAVDAVFDAVGDAAEQARHLRDLAVMIRAAVPEVPL